MILRLFVLLLVQSIFTKNAFGYKPVVIVHGILTGAPSMILMVAEIQMVRIVIVGLEKINKNIYIRHRTIRAQLCIMLIDLLVGLVWKMLGIKWTKSVMI